MIENWSNAHYSLLFLEYDVKYLFQISEDRWSKLGFKEYMEWKLMVGR